MTDTSAEDHAMVEVRRAELQRWQQNLNYDTREVTVDYLVYKDRWRATAAVAAETTHGPCLDDDGANFVDMLMIGLPAPLIIVCWDDANATMQVVDGRKRVAALRAFVRDGWITPSSSLIPGLAFNQLRAEQQRNILRSRHPLLVLDNHMPRDVTAAILKMVNPRR